MIHVLLSSDSFLEFANKFNISTQQTLAYNQLSTKSHDPKVDKQFLTSVENTQRALKSEFQVFITQALARVRAIASQSVPDSQMDAV